MIRASASDSLIAFAEKLQIPVATTFMAKGAIPFSHELSLGTVGLKARDWVSFGFEKADAVICVGYDMVEYHPEQWHPDGNKAIVHIDVSPAEVDEHYILKVGVLGDLGEALPAISRQAKAQAGYSLRSLREVIVNEMAEFDADDSFPIKPQRIVSDLRRALAAEDIVISRWAHKMWMGGCIRRSGQTHASSRTGSLRWASPCPDPWQPSSRIRIAKSWRSPAMPDL